MRIGKQMKQALTFINKVNGWHSYNRKDRPAVNGIERLAKLGLVELSGFSQFKITEQGKIKLAQMNRQ